GSRCDFRHQRNYSASDYRQNWFLHATLTVASVGAYNARRLR
ncbi:hypothetical protein LTSEMIS_1329, partial [Salmonella enterica subsp. enterica serovar Mississippi str. A4-633]